MENHDFNIIWIEFCKYLPQSRIDKHEHSFFHYIFVIEGTGDIEIGENKFTLRHNRIYLMPPRTSHSFQNTGDNILYTIEIKFETENENILETLLKFPSYLNLKNTPAKEILTVIYNEMSSKPVIYTEIINLKFMEFITYLMRFSSRQNTKKIKSDFHKNSYKNIDEISRVVNYIHSHIEDEITLETLAKEANLEKSYFLKKFKRIMGFTPMQFIRDARIERAKELLRFSDMNITQVSSASGFQSIHHFSNLFFKQTGSTPSQYRISIKDL